MQDVVADFRFHRYVFLCRIKLFQRRHVFDVCRFDVDLKRCALLEKENVTAENQSGALKKRTI